MFVRGREYGLCSFNVLEMACFTVRDQRDWISADDHTSAIKIRAKTANPHKKTEVTQRIHAYLSVAFCLLFHVSPQCCIVAHYVHALKSILKKHGLKNTIWHLLNRIRFFQASELKRQNTVNYGNNCNKRNALKFFFIGFWLILPSLLVQRSIFTVHFL